MFILWKVFKIMAESHTFTFKKIFDTTELWYHGTTSNYIESLQAGVKVDYLKRNCDFGVGFYLTSRLEQAKRWAQRKVKDRITFDENIKPVVVSYALNKEIINDSQVFEIDNDFFHFIYQNRCGKEKHNYSLIFGPVLDGQLSRLDQIMEDFEHGKSDLATISQKLLGKFKDDDQLCICNQEIADKIVLKEIKCYEINDN